jgi:hypothetical protein
MGVFIVRDGVSDVEVIGTFRRYRDLAVSKGYITRADVQAVNATRQLLQPGSTGR